MTTQVETIVENLAAIHIRSNLGMYAKNPHYAELLRQLVQVGLSFISAKPGKLDAKIKIVDELFSTLHLNGSKYVMQHSPGCAPLKIDDTSQSPKPDVSYAGRPEPTGYGTFIESVVYQHATVNSIGIGSRCAHDAMCRSAQTILEHCVVDVQIIQPFKLCCEVLSAYVWNGIQYVPYITSGDVKEFTTLADMDTMQVPPRSDIKIDVASRLRGTCVKLPTAAVVATLQGNDHYHFQRNDVQYIITRGYGESPAGNPLQGSWICHEIFTGKYVDHDQYRSDLFERLNLKVG